MKTTCCLALGLSLLSTAFSRDFRPDGHLENIPATDSSVQQCYVFRSLPGVCYRVESSHDLTQWTTEDEIYGLGHEYVVAMREFTPPPPPEPGTAPPAPIVPPAKNVSLFIQPSSEAAGGTVVSWTSLDHGGPVKRLLDQTMTSGWNQMPLFWDHYGDFSFFILHAAHVVAPAEESLPLDSQDAAVFAELENSFPLMNQAIDDSVARARNAPPPAPADPNSHKFWRVHCDWSIDTDQDGSPDWAEFEMAASGTGGMVAGVMGNAFDADINGDGIPDGEQLDSDGDGTADARDIAPDDKTANFEIGPLPRYALFLIANAAPDPVFTKPIQINDQGTVLYSTGTWTGGIWKPLAGATGGPNDWTLACRINDLGEIIGTQLWDRGANPEDLTDDRLWNPGNLVYWASPAAAWEFAHVGEDYPEIRDLYDYYPGSPSISFSNSGQLLAYNQKIDYIDEYGFPWTTTEGPFLWTLPGQGRTPGITASLSGYGGVIDSSHYWGWVYEQNAGPRLFANGATIIAAHMIRNLHIGPGGELITCFDSNADTQVFMDAAWHPSSTFAKAIDMAADGTAIGKAHDGLTAPILLNGKWTGIERSAPDLPGGGQEPAMELLDTTTSGWVLAKRPLSSSQTEHSVMLPIRVKGRYETVKIDAAGNETPLTLTQGVGVDDFSIGADSPDSTAMDSIWIMAPAGDGATELTVNAPLNLATPLNLSGFGVLKFGALDEITFSEPEKTFTLRAADGSDSSGYDVRIVPKLGEIESLSRPLIAKVMKRRTVKVTVYKISRKLSDEGTPIPPDPDIMPTEEQLENHLDNIFKPQLNVDFAVTMDSAEYAVKWDLEDSAGRTNGVLDNAENFNDHSAEQQMIHATPPQTDDANIKVFLVSCEGGVGSAGTAYGITSRGQRTCWVMGSRVRRNNSSQFVMDTIGHEIGHVLVDYGHPDSETEGQKGHAPLPGTTDTQRLMCSGNNSGSKSRILVVGEWCEAEKWLKENVDK